MASIATVNIRPCHADVSDCADSRVQIVGEIGPTWTTELDRICRRFANWSNIDPRVKLRFWEEGEALVIQAVVPDGRIAERRIQRPDQLGITTEALVTLPPQNVDSIAAPALSNTAVPSGASASNRVQITDKLQVLSRPKPDKQSPKVKVTIEPGTAVEGRVEGKGTYTTVGLSGWALLRVDTWMLGLHIRWDPWQVSLSTGPEGFELDTVGAGLMAAHRFELGRAVSLDVGLTSWVLDEAITYESTNGELSSVVTDTRLGTITRAHIGTGRLRFAVSAEAEVSPIRLRRSIRVDEQQLPLPSFSFALAMGASWGGT